MYPWLRSRAAVALSACAIALTVACKVNEAGPAGSPRPIPPDSGEVLKALAPQLQALEPDGSRYVAATVEITCLMHAQRDPRRVATSTFDIYKRHGFADPMTYLALMPAQEADARVQQALSEGERLCRPN